jgi:hypothetical protein
VEPLPDEIERHDEQYPVDQQKVSDEVYSNVEPAIERSKGKSKVRDQSAAPGSPLETDEENGMFSYSPLEHKDSIQLLILEPASDLEDDLNTSLKDVRWEKIRTMKQSPTHTSSRTKLAK